MVIRQWVASNVSLGAGTLKADTRAAGQSKDCSLFSLRHPWYHTSRILPPGSGCFAMFDWWNFDVSDRICEVRKLGFFIDPAPLDKITCYCSCTRPRFCSYGLSSLPRNKSSKVVLTLLLWSRINWFAEWILKRERTLRLVCCGARLLFRIRWSWNLGKYVTFY